MIEITSRAPDCKIRAYDTGEIVLSAPLTRRMRLKDGDHVQIFMCRSNGFEEMFIAKCDGIRRGYQQSAGRNEIGR